MEQIELHNKNISVEQYRDVINKELLQSYINYLDVKETTLKGYITCVKRFYKYLLDNNIKTPTRGDILAYKAYLDSNRKYTSGTKRQYLRAVKSFFEWTDTMDIYPNVARNIKPAKVKQDNSRKDSFSAEDIKIILDSINTETESGARDYSIILLCVTCGLRIIEIQRADIEDLQRIKGQLRIYIQGKGHDDKDDYKKIVPELEKSINKYLSYRTNTQSKEPLFTSLCRRENTGGRLTEPSISRIIKNRFRQAGYDTKRLTARSLRHTSNTLLFESGADLFAVQRHARHQDPKTTVIYIHDKEKETSRNEEIIYNMIFKTKQEDTLEERINKLSPDKIKELNDYLKEV